MFCSKIEKVLQLSSLEHKIYKLGQHFTGEEFYSEFCDESTLRKVIINAIEHLGGCTNNVKYFQKNKVI
jgi:hypothetical protein